MKRFRKLYNSLFSTHTQESKPAVFSSRLPMHQASHAVLFHQRRIGPSLFNQFFNEQRHNAIGQTNLKHASRLGTWDGLSIQRIYFSVSDGGEEDIRRFCREATFELFISGRRCADFRVSPYVVRGEPGRIIDLRTEQIIGEPTDKLELSIPIEINGDDQFGVNVHLWRPLDAVVSVTAYLEGIHITPVQ